MALTAAFSPATAAISTGKCRFRASISDGFPSFLPKEVQKIKDPFTRSLARRIERLPVEMGFSETVMSSCVRPRIQSKSSPIVLLHGFDSNCLEWGGAYPLLEGLDLETWAIDILGWGFSDLESRPSCSASAKRRHLYQFWKSHIRKPMILVGPSLGAATAVDFAANHPEAVAKLVLINANVYAEGTNRLAKLPDIVAYAGVSFLRCIPLRLWANMLAFNGISPATYDQTNIGRLHCLLPWWNDATVNFMKSGGYNVISQIKEVKQQVLIIYGERDRIVSNLLAVKLRCELSNAILRQAPGSGHLPHVDNPRAFAKLIEGFVRDDRC